MVGPLFVVGVLIGLIASLIVAIVFGALSARAANRRGLREANAFILGFLFGPIGLFATLLWPGGLALDLEHRGYNTVCPSCYSVVPGAASICRYCQTKL